MSQIRLIPVATLSTLKIIISVYLLCVIKLYVNSIQLVSFLPNQVFVLALNSCFHGNNSISNSLFRWKILRAGNILVVLLKLDCSIVLSSVYACIG